MVRLGHASYLNINSQTMLHPVANATELQLDMIFNYTA